jgi:hypothetical protein
MSKKKQASRVIRNPQLKDIRKLEVGDDVVIAYGRYPVKTVWVAWKTPVIGVAIVRGSTLSFLPSELKRVCSAIVKKAGL